MSYTLCPTLIEKGVMDNFCLSSKVLLQIISSPIGVRIYLDQEGRLLDEYQKIIHANSVDNITVQLFMDHIVTNLENKNHDTISKKSVNIENYSNFQELVIALSNISSKQVLLNDKYDYNGLGTDGLELLEPRDFFSLISGSTLNIGEVKGGVQLGSHSTQDIR